MSDFRITIPPDRKLRDGVRKALAVDASVEYGEFDEANFTESLDSDSMQVIGHGFSFLTIGGLAALMKYAAPVLVECLKRGRIKVRRGDLTIEAASVSDLNRALEAVRDLVPPTPTKTNPRKKAT